MAPSPRSLQASSDSREGTGAARVDSGSNLDTFGLERKSIRIAEYTESERRNVVGSGEERQRSAGTANHEHSENPENLLQCLIILPDEKPGRFGTAPTPCQPHEHDSVAALQARCISLVYTQHESLKLNDRFHLPLLTRVLAGILVAAATSSSAESQDVRRAAVPPAHGDGLDVNDGARGWRRRRRFDVLRAPCR